MNVASSEALLASGNSSLAIAQSDLSTNSNLTVGIQLVHSAMSDFTNASASASISLQGPKTDAFLQIAESLDSINAANGTANQISSVITLACTTNPTNSSLNSQFQRDCVSGRELHRICNDRSQAGISFAHSFRNNPICVNNQ